MLSQNPYSFDAKLCCQDLRRNWSEAISLISLISLITLKLDKSMQSEEKYTFVFVLLFVFVFVFA